MEDNIEIKFDDLVLSGNCIGFLHTIDTSESVILDPKTYKPIPKEVTISRVVQVAKSGLQCTDYKEGQTVILKRNCVDTNEHIVITDMSDDTKTTILIIIPHYNIDGFLK